MNPCPALTLADDFGFDLDVLLETRLLVQASSGGGKSHALRRLIEQAAPHVQILVIDLEGEFASLREKFDFVVCAPSGADAVANPVTAALLARRLLETKVSAILNIYDLSPDDRRAFVRSFCDSLVNSPKKLWRPVLIILDEAHVFAPEAGKSESAQAVIDLATRGRKRGFALCLATQRLSKLHKDAAAEMVNKMIGRTSVDVDVKRAADELGKTVRDGGAELRALRPGQFFAYGPAFPKAQEEGVQRFHVGPVTTTHPKAGRRLLDAPPPPSDKIRAILAEGLQDLTQEAEKEALTIEQLRAERDSLRHQLADAHRDREIIQSRPPGIDAINLAVQRAKKEVWEAACQSALEVANIPRIRGLLTQALDLLPNKLLAPVNIELSGDGMAEIAHLPPPPGEKKTAWRTPTPADLGYNPSPFEEARVIKAEIQGSGAQNLKRGARDILGQLAARAPLGWTAVQLATLTGFTVTGGTFGTYVSQLKARGYISKDGDSYYSTAEGRTWFKLTGAVAPTTRTPADMLGLWNSQLKAGARRMLKAILDGKGMSRSSLGEVLGMEITGGTFQTYLSILRRLHLVEERSGLFYPSPMLTGK